MQMSNVLRVLLRGANEQGNLCTSCTLYYEPITPGEYGEELAPSELKAFQDHHLTYCRITATTGGLSRTYGGKSSFVGPWLSNRKVKPGENAQIIFALPKGNTAAFCDIVEISEGARVAFGPIAGGFGDQIRVSRLDLHLVRRLDSRSLGT
jgi:hypothetical protein